MPTRIFLGATVAPKRIFDNVVWPKRICIDLDGVVCEYDFPKIVKEHFGVDLKPDCLFAYDLADVLGTTSEKINAMFENQVWGAPCFIKGAIDTLQEWKSQGHELVIYSNRVKYMGESGLVKWLIKWQIPFNALHEQIRNKRYPEYILTPNYDAHIDDSPAKLMSTNSRRKLLFNQPWNERCLNITGELVRVLDWKEIREYDV